MIFKNSTLYKTLDKVWNYFCPYEYYSVFRYPAIAVIAFVAVIVATFIDIYQSLRKVND